MYVKSFVPLLTVFAVLVPHVLSCSPKCNSTTLNVMLGSEVLLPCTLLISNYTKEAKWSQNYSMVSLVSIQPGGNVTFDDPRGGRVVVYPLQFNRGNFSILIHQFRDSDVGMYCCQLSQECQQVEINLLQNGGGKTQDFPWYYIGAGVGAFILLLIAVSLMYEFRGMWVTKSSDSYYVNNENKHAEGAEDVRSDQCDADYEDMESDNNQDDYVNVQDVEHDRHEKSESENQEDFYVNAERREGEDDVVNQDLGEHRVENGQKSETCIYDNEEHIPNRRRPCETDLREIPMQKKELRPPHYVNHSEIHQPCSTDKRRKDKEYQFKNPLYSEHTTGRKK